MLIRPPAVSGTFYPDDPTLLTLQVDHFLEEHATTQLPGTVLGLIVPHAGYRYSGFTAAAAYALLRHRQFSTAVIISPSHREYFNGISIFEGDAYRTPLGLIETDTTLREKLRAHKGALTFSRFGHRTEHAVEVQLPFLQRINDELRILPIVMGDQRPELCMLLGRILAEETDPSSTVIIASSDLSHMHPHHEARRLDSIATEAILALSPSRLLHDLAAGSTEACGGGPISALLQTCILHKADGAHVLHQCTSGDVTGEESRVVGYLSAAITRSPRYQD